MNELLLFALATSSVISLFALQYDIAVNNRELPKKMRIIWLLVIMWFGLIGFAVYWQTSRT